MLGTYFGGVLSKLKTPDMTLCPNLLHEVCTFNGVLLHFTQSFEQGSKIYFPENELFSQIKATELGLPGSMSLL